MQCVWVKYIVWQVQAPERLSGEQHIFVCSRQKECIATQLKKAHVHCSSSLLWNGQSCMYCYVFVIPPPNKAGWRYTGHIWSVCPSVWMILSIQHLLKLTGLYLRIFEICTNDHLHTNEIVHPQFSLRLTNLAQLLAQRYSRGIQTHSAISISICYTLTFYGIDFCITRMYIFYTGHHAFWFDIYFNNGLSSYPIMIYTLFSSEQVSS